MVRFRIAPLRRCIHLTRRQERILRSEIKALEARAPVSRLPQPRAAQLKAGSCRSRATSGAAQPRSRELGDKHSTTRRRPGMAGGAVAGHPKGIITMMGARRRRQSGRVAGGDAGQIRRRYFRRGPCALLTCDLPLDRHFLSRRADQGAGEREGPRAESGSAVQAYADEHQAYLAGFKDTKAGGHWKRGGPSGGRGELLSHGKICEMLSGKRLPRPPPGEPPENSFRSSMRTQLCRAVGSLGLSADKRPDKIFQTETPFVNSN